MRKCNRSPDNPKLWSFANMHSDRSWPLPTTKHFMRMRWHDVLFAHWPVEADHLDRLLPNGVKVDRYEDRVWVGIVPFHMSDVAPRFFPALPGLSAFPEINVRTYVTLDEKPGVWFFSLDATNPLAVRAARHFFHLPYRDAQIRIQPSAQGIEYRSLCTHRGEPSAMFVAKYGPNGDVFRAPPGSFEHWANARYCLYTIDRRGRILRGEIDHPAWRLQRANAEIFQNTMVEGLALNISGQPHLLFAKETSVVAWRNTRVS